MDKVQNNMDPKTGERHKQSLQVLETNLLTKPTIKSNGKDDCQESRQNNDKGIHDRQHGFRKNKSTESAISETANYIEKQNEDVIGVFLDIQAAIDTITPTSMKEAPLKHNLDDKLVGWYYTFLTHRHLITEHNGVTSLPNFFRQSLKKVRNLASK